VERYPLLRARARVESTREKSAAWAKQGNKFGRGSGTDGGIGSGERRLKMPQCGGTHEEDGVIIGYEAVNAITHPASHIGAKIHLQSRLLPGYKELAPECVDGNIYTQRIL
jgi:hypothetical protein